MLYSKSKFYLIFFTGKFYTEYFIHISIIHNSIYIIKYIIIMHCGNVGILINKGIARE